MGGNVVIGLPNALEFLFLKRSIEDVCLKSPVILIVEK